MKNKIKLIISSSLSGLAVISVLGIFCTNIVLPTFPYKITSISSKIKKVNVDNQSIKNYLSIDKEKILNDLKKQTEETKVLSENTNKKLESVSVSKNIDFGSMMIFAEQKTLENSLQLLDLNFVDLTKNKTQQSTKVEETKPIENKIVKPESQENKPVNPDTIVPTSDNETNSIEPNYEQIGEFTPSIVKIRVFGPYQNIQTFLSKLPSELGSFNYIDNLKIWKSKEDLAKEGINKKDSYLFEDEKSIIAEFDLVMYNKK